MHFGGRKGEEGKRHHLLYIEGTKSLLFKGVWGQYILAKKWSYQYLGGGKKERWVPLQISKRYPAWAGTKGLLYRRGKEASLRSTKSSDQGCRPKKKGIEPFKTTKGESAKREVNQGRLQKGI